MNRLTSTVLAVLLIGLAISACRPAPAPAPASSCDDPGARNAQEQFYADSAAAICAAFPEPNLHAIALCIAGRESGLYPGALNGQYRGIFQLGSNYNGSLAVTGDGDPFNPYTNAAVARIVYDARGGWSAWSTSRSCA